MKLLLPLAAAAIPLALMPGMAFAGGNADPTYQATLNPLNNEQASGTVTVQVNGNQATITEQVMGLAGKLPTDKGTLKSLHIPTKFAGAPFPHVQHIHGLGKGQCPTMSADTNGDGVVSTVEGGPAYGKIQATLSTKGDTSPAAGTDVTIAPSGSSYHYSRTITLNSGAMKALQEGNAVVVVHGLNPATAAKAALSTPNPLGAVLPGESKPVALIATAPALCGSLTAMPTGAPQTGAGSTAGPEHLGLFGAGGAAVILGGGVLLWTRKRSHAGTQS